MNCFAIQRVAATLVIIQILFLLTSNVWALGVSVRKSISFRELYSDNINQESSGNEQGALVTEISPGITVNGQSARYRVNLAYRLQGLYNAGGNSAVDINHQLQFNSKSTFIQNRLFLDSRSSISQQNTSNQNIASDNFTGSNDRSTVTTFSLSPYWTPHFSQFANGLFRATYDRVDSSQGALSATNSFSQNASLFSGRYFSKVRWSANFNNRTNNNSSGETITFQDSNAQIRYLLSREFSLSAQAGHSSNDFQRTSNTNQNGFFYNFGGQWRPSHRFSINAGWGNNSFITVFISPFSRLQWTTTYRNNDVGTNTGNVWQTNLSYRTQQSRWGFTYNEDTTTVQQVLLEERVFVLINDGNIVTDVNGNPVLFNTALPTLTDEVFVRKRGQLAYSFFTGKSNIGLTVFNERRTFQSTSDEDNVYGISGNWNWRYSSRINTSLRSSYQVTDAQSTLRGDSNSKRFDISFVAQRNLSQRVSGNIAYQYTSQSSDVSTNDFDENRISLSLNARF